MYNFSSFEAFILTTNGQTIGNGDAVDYINLIWQHLNSQYYTYPPSDPGATDHAIKWGVLNAEALEANINTPAFVKVDKEAKKGTFVRLPERNELNQEINELLIVEYYNR